MWLKGAPIWSPSSFNGLAMPPGAYLNYANSSDLMPLSREAVVVSVHI